MRHQLGLTGTLMPLLGRPTARIGELNTVRFRLVIISLLLLTIGLAHWLTPIDHPFFHGLHVVMRKMFILPVVLAAVWFDLSGALVVAGAATALYVPHVFTQWAGHFAENLNQIGEVVTMWVVATISGWLVGRQKKALEDLVETHRGATTALVAALDAREHQTELHSLRVQAYAMRIAREMGMSKPELAILAQGAALHDVGKIGIPDQILLKPGPLDEQEWQVMRRHPEIGRNILAPVRFLKRAIDVVYAHHERYDGNGYPRGLSREQIPLNARVFAVADAFDAMTSDRPYQTGTTIEEARHRINEDSSTHFDPRIVEAFLRIPTSEWEQIAQGLSHRVRGTSDRAG